MPIGIVTLGSWALVLIGLAGQLVAQQTQAQVQPDATYLTNYERQAARITTNKTQVVKRQHASSGRDPEVERVKKQGQLESFSMEATGLGDLEEADAIRIMMRRSREHQAHIESIKSAISKRWPQTLSDRSKRSTHYERILRSLLKRRAAMPPRDEEEENVEISQPIAITRRTAEELANTANNREEERGGEQLDGRMPGEFGSRLSLLTTRKIQPEELLMSPAPQDPNVLANLLNYELYRLETGVPPPLDGARAPLNIRNELVALLGPINANDRTTAGIDYAGRRASNGQERPALIGTDSNYLPRIARGLIM